MHCVVIVMCSMKEKAMVCLISDIATCIELKFGSFWPTVYIIWCLLIFIYHLVSFDKKLKSLLMEWWN